MPGGLACSTAASIFPADRTREWVHLSLMIFKYLPNCRLPYRHHSGCSADRTIRWLAESAAPLAAIVERPGAAAPPPAKPLRPSACVHSMTARRMCAQQ